LGADQDYNDDLKQIREPHEIFAEKHEIEDKG
jgi:hypothetical protein